MLHHSGKKEKRGRNKMTVKEIFDEPLKDLCNKYSQENEQLGSLLEKTIKNSKNNEIIVPVLGMQGMGKSTLINGILQENILPNDVDETTCVPVEVKYGETEQAEVYFYKKSDIEIIHTREELNQYVDNNYNPGNKKEVLKIILYRKNNLLKNGLIIVDLPGVGSMTRENESTTKHYIENLCTAVFVIPTVPTIRRMEAFFIKGVWSQFSTALFVQNVWDETEKEIKDSVRYNTIQLKNIASELRNEFTSDIIIVNAYDAIKASIDNNPVLRKESNIDSLISKIQELSENWEQHKQNSILNRIYISLQFIEKQIAKRIDDASKTQKEIRAQREKEYNDYKISTSKIQEKIDAIKKEFEDDTDVLKIDVKQGAKKCCGEIRARINRVIDKGVVDGQQLTQAFSDIQEEETSLFFEEVFPKFIALKFKLEEQLVELNNVIEIENDLSFQSIPFNNGNSFKGEKALVPVFNIAGIIGGYFAGAGVAGLVAGGTLAAFSGPIGIAVFIGVSLISGIIGKLTKKGITKSRGTETKKQMAPYIEEIEDVLKNKIVEKLETIKNLFTNAMDKIIQDRKSEEEKLKKKISEAIVIEDEAALKNDLLYVQKKMEVFRR